MMVGFAAKAAIVLARRFGWRYSRIALDSNPSSFAIGQNISLRLVISPRNFLPVAARAAEFAVQFFCALILLMDAPGVIRRCAAFRPFSRLLRRVWMRFVSAHFIAMRFIVPRLSRRWRAWRREVGPGQPYQLIAELFAQDSGAHFFDFALTKLAELERPERDADEPSDA
jgi:hypothetical protein